MKVMVRFSYLPRLITIIQVAFIGPLQDTIQAIPIVLIICILIILMFLLMTVIIVIDILGLPFALFKIIK